MTPEEMRKRAREILERQTTGQVIEMRSDGSLVRPGERPPGKKTVLHDPKGEYSGKPCSNLT